jgi:hypothetical protein
MGVDKDAVPQPISMLALLGTAGLTVACGSGYNATGMGGAGGTSGAVGTGGAAGASDAGAPTALVAPECTADANAPCAPSGFPFVQFSIAHSDACAGACTETSPVGTTIRFSQPATGTLCLSGTNLAPNGTGIALIFTVFSDEVFAGYHKVLNGFFNADLLGITQLRFTIDNPPPAGVQVSADTIHQNECNGVDCLWFGFIVPGHITESGTSTVAFTDFVADPVRRFDTRGLDAIGFDVGPGDFDFCVRDFHFLDANGSEVKPPSVSQVDASADAALVSQGEAGIRAGVDGSVDQQ